MKLEDGGLMARFPHTLGVLAAVVALTASGCTSASPRPSVSRPAPSSPNGAHGDFAGLVDIGGGHKLFLECHGSGSPTVILLSGYGNAGDIWNEADAHPPAVAPGAFRFALCTHLSRAGHRTGHDRHRDSTNEDRTRPPSTGRNISNRPSSNPTRYPATRVSSTIRTPASNRSIQPHPCAPCR